MSQKKKTLSLEEITASVQTLFTSTHPSDTPKIGLELEFLPIVQDNGEFSVADYSNSTKTGVLDVIKSDALASPRYQHQKNAEGASFFTNEEGGNITFEPSSQVEYSSSPQPIKEAISEVSTHVSYIFDLFSKQDISLFCGAINPWSTPEEVGLKLKKDRYIHMNNYYNSVNEYGRKMMRMTTALQVSFDVGTEEETVQRWVTGNLLTPILTAIFGNSPFAEKKNTQLKSFRTKIWNTLDPGRTGIILGNTIPRTTKELESLYLSFALNANVMRLPDNEGKLTFQTNTVKFIDWLENGYQGSYPEHEDWETHLSTLFPAIRPKGFFEFRGIDGQCRSWWMIPAVFLYRILYDSAISDQVIDLLTPYLSQVQEMQSKAAILGVSAFPELCRKIFQLALHESSIEVPHELLQHLEKFYKQYTARGVSPADELLAINNGDLFSVDQYRCYESCLLKMASPPQYALFPTSIHTESDQYKKCLEHYLLHKDTKN